MDDTVSAIKGELTIQQNYLSEHSVNSIYFGGGTPSLLTGSQIRDLLQHIKKLFPIGEDPEITLEANPDDLNPDYLESLRGLGINRLSIGIQSFDQSVLEWMNRAHNNRQSIGCFEAARDAGFENLSLDLIYAIPLPEYSFVSDLEQALQLAPDHISAYNLTIEPGTLFGHHLKKGLLSEVSEQEAAENFQLAMHFLKDKGFLHYEISNFCKPGKESRHNLGYWNGEPYLGIGPSAHSFDGVHRQYNISSNGRYLQMLQQGQVPCTSEKLLPYQRINEIIMLGLRTSRGVQLQLDADGQSWNIEQQCQDYLEQLIKRKLATVQKNRLLLTDKGKLFADKIAEDLFLEPDKL